MWLVILLLFWVEPTQGGYFIVSKAECKSLDMSFSYFKNCAMKTDTKNSTALNFHVVFRYKKPVDDVTVGITLFKMAKAYSFPIINETLDFCAFLRQPILSHFFYHVAISVHKLSNINHTCPFQHDVIVAGTLPERILPSIPAPNGNYTLQLRVGAFKKWKANVKVYVSRIG